MSQLIVSIEGTENRTVDLRKPTTTLGRRSDNDIVLADRAVSGRHCVFERQGADRFVLEDLGSTNGTFVNGRPVAAVSPIGFGDELGIGQVRLRLERARSG